MVASKNLLGLLVLTSVLLLFPPAARATDSIVQVSDSAAAISPEIVQVILTGGDTLQARCVQPAPFDMIAVTGWDRGIRYLPAIRIKAVLDSDSKDQTSSVLERRETVGMPLPPEVRPHPPEFPTDPRSRSKTFVTTETSFMRRVKTGVFDRADLRYDLGFELGLMENVSTSTALGWGWFFASSDGYVNGGMRLHYRRWLSRASAVEIAPGLIATEKRLEGGGALPPGFSIQANLSLSRFLILSSELYTIRRREYGSTALGTYEPHEVRETGVLIGAKIGRWPGAAAGAVAALMALSEGTVFGVYDPGKFRP